MCMPNKHGAQNLSYIMKIEHDEKTESKKTGK